MEQITAYDGYWNNFPDVDLSPVDLAEKKWTIAKEQQEKALRSYTVESVQYCTGAVADTTKMWERTREIETGNAVVQTLWLEWVNLKPYVSDEMKKHLGCNN